jgi:glycosyltransferase involved in cell wall biosynthesis
VISFIVPTLWKCNKLIESINSFIDAKIEGAELIIIDNANSDFNDKDIICLKQKENIGVNPAWNLGVKTAKNDLICLLNDDITFNFSTLKTNIETLTTMSEECMIGFDANQNFFDTLNDSLEVFHFNEAPCRTLGFGCMMILNKKNYIHIDERMKVFCGDDLLYWWNKDKHNRKIYNITNLKATGELSVTSKDYEHLMHPEVDIFQEVIRNL